MALVENFDPSLSIELEDDEALVEYKIQSHSRAQFHAIFRFLADAIDPKHFDNCPVIFIDGGDSTWKSLAADIMMRCFDDMARFQGIRNNDFDHAHGFSGEAWPCEASRKPSKIETLSAGVLAEFFFRSGLGRSWAGFDLASTVSELNPDGDKHGVIFCTGATEKHDDKILDIFIKHHFPLGIHSINIMPTNDGLLNCPRFKAYMDILDKAEHTEQLITPDPSNWLDGGASKQAHSIIYI